MMPDPVPCAASPNGPDDATSMFTMLGRTALATAATDPAPSADALTGGATLTVPPPAELCVATIVVPEPINAPMSAATNASTIGDCRPRGGASRGGGAG